MIHLNDSNYQSKDIVMEEDKISEGNGFKNIQNIFDIKKTTDNL